MPQLGRRGAMSPPAPPSTSAPRRRRFGERDAKQLVRIMQDPNLHAVDPAPRRVEGVATAREVREALDHGVPANVLYRYKRQPQLADVDHHTWDARWKPVLEEHKTPQNRPAYLGARPSTGNLFAEPAADEPPLLARAKSFHVATSAPKPRPLPSPAYVRPTSVLADPDSVAKKRAAKMAEDRAAAKRRARKIRLGTQAAHRLPRAEEDWRVQAVGSVESIGARCGTAEVMRRWSRPGAYHDDPDQDAVSTSESTNYDARALPAAESTWSLACASMASLDSTAASARTWPAVAPSPSSCIATARGAGRARDAGGDLLDMVLGTGRGQSARLRTATVEGEAPALLLPEPKPPSDTHMPARGRLGRTKSWAQRRREWAEEVAEQVM